MAGEITFKRVDLGDGVVYEGEIEDGKRFVFGKYSFQVVTYIGEFNHESGMEGMGKLTLEKKDGKMIYVGTFKGAAPNGLPLLNGYGARHFLNIAEPEEFKNLNGGIKYDEGKFVDDELHGQGAIYYNDGSKYEGGFAHGRMHGKGTVTKADGTTFSVEYDNGKQL